MLVNIIETSHLLLVGLLVGVILALAVFGFICTRFNAKLEKEIQHFKEEAKIAEQRIWEFKKYVSDYECVLKTLRDLAAQDSKCQCQIKVTEVVNNTDILNLETFVVLRKDENFDPSKTHGRYQFTLILLNLKDNEEVCELKAFISFEPDEVVRFNGIKSARIERLETPVAHERRGYARFLLRHFLLYCRNNDIDKITGTLDQTTRIGMDHLRQFYQNEGFKTTETTFYSDSTFSQCREWLEKDKK